MEDKELLELAAKAVGIECYEFSGAYFYVDAEGREKKWNPLTDDGDALRLAVKLSLNVDCFDECVRTFTEAYFYTEDKGNDPYAATRRAIVRAAAEIGKTK